MTITLRPAGPLSRARSAHRAALLSLAVVVAMYKRYNDAKCARLATAEAWERWRLQ